MAHGQIVGYVRVSTLDQNPARQVEARGQVDRLFTDHVSGKSRRNRPALTECLNYVREGDTARARIVASPAWSELCARGRHAAGGVDGSTGPVIDGP